MIKIRLAQKDEIDRQKEIWKICFGDEDAYIDFYFSKRYQDNETAVLLWEDTIVAMATMIHLNLVMPKGKKHDISMLYAVATLPEYQGLGYSSKIIDFCNNYLKEQGKEFSVLVPAGKSLFDFYEKRGYREGFYIRELTLSNRQILAFKEDIKERVTLQELTASEYNRRRRRKLEGQLYVDYHDHDIEYQKKISQKFGADLYGINIGDIKGCAMIERIDSSSILIKEILIPDGLLEIAIKKIHALLPAQAYTFRLPVHLGERLGGIKKAFGMVELNELFLEGDGYLGIAYD